MSCIFTKFFSLSLPPSLTEKSIPLLFFLFPFSFFFLVFFFCVFCIFLFFFGASCKTSTSDREQGFPVPFRFPSHHFSLILLFSCIIPIKFSAVWVDTYPYCLSVCLPWFPLPPGSAPSPCIFSFATFVFFYVSQYSLRKYLGFGMTNKEMGGGKSKSTQCTETSK